jgi:microcystin-dependent protein
MPALKYWDGTTWKKASLGAGYETAPIGSLLSWTGKTVPAGFVLADGATYTKQLYPQGYDFAKAEKDAGNPLWNYVLDTSFTVPDLRDRFILSAGSRALGILSQTNPAVANPGEETHTLSSVESGQKAVTSGTESADHTHTVSYNGLVPDAIGPAWAYATNSTYGAALIYVYQHGTGGRSQAHTHSISGSAATTPHNNMPPYAVLSQIIKVAGVTISGAAIQGQPGSAGASGGQTYTQLIGDALNTSFTVTHGFNAPVMVSVIRAGSPYDEVEVDVEHVSASSVIIRTLPTVPAVGEYLVRVMAAGSPGSLPQITMDTWHIVGQAGEPAFQNSWVNVGAIQLARFRKYPDGRVRIAGLIRTGASATVAFTLPVGYRPPYDMSFLVQSSGNPPAIINVIAATGAVTPANGPSSNVTGFVYLDGVEFDTETVQQTASVAAQPLEPWHTVGAAGEPAFMGSPPWYVYAPVQFRKDPTGKVTIRGTARNGAGFAFNAASAYVFTLPVGYRPPSQVDFTTRVGEPTTGQSLVMLRVVNIAAGLAGSTSGTANSFLTLDGIEFDTDTVGAYATGVIGPSVVTALPVVPYDGQEIYYLADATNGVMWHLRYRAASASAYKWEYVGGAPLHAAETATHNPVTNTAAADKNGGPTLAIPLAGDYEITFVAELYNTPNSYQYCGMHTAANVLIDSWLYHGNFSGFGVVASRTGKVAALAAQTIKARVMTGGSTGGYVQGARVLARPIRVG